MNNNKEKSDENINDNIEINNNNEEKKDITYEENGFKKYCPVIKHLKPNKSYKSFPKPKLYKSPKNQNKNSLRLPFMGLPQNKQNNLKINNLLNLEPFFTDFNNTMDKKGKEIIRDMASEYRDEKYEINKVIFRYGDEADKYYIIYEGEVSFYFPFTETIDMNIDEYFIYILRLRRYNEIEILNTILLLNKGEFMKDFDDALPIDDIIYKLYTTYLKLLFDPTFLYYQETKKKKPKKHFKEILNNIYHNSKKNNKINKNKSSSNCTKITIDYEEDKGIDINIFDYFSDRKIKELLLRIGDELIETMKYIMPENMYTITEEKNGEIIIKKIVKIPQKLVKKYQKLDPNSITGEEYCKRILPEKRPNSKLTSKKIIIMKYLYIYTLNTGKSFGDYNSDSLTLFSHHYLNIAKNSLVSLNLHKFRQFRNMTAITTKTFNMENRDKIHLLSFNKRIYSKYFSKYIEKKTYEKKKFLLNNGLFLDTNNKNLIRTYSECFNEIKLKEGEYVISEKDKLKESNIYIYFIISGECQSTCNKSISEIDEVLKILGREQNIKDTYTKPIKDIINTPLYEELIKKPMHFKLNYLSRNDIIGLTEIYKNDEYFNNVISTSNNTRIYQVDTRIIKLLVDADPIIKNNKNIIIYNKYQLICDILLKQRKMYFDSFINMDAIDKMNNLSNEHDKLIKKKLNIGKKNAIKYKNNKIITSFEYSKISQASLSKNYMNHKMNSIKNNVVKKYKYNISNKDKKGEDIDQILCGVNRFVTLSELRMAKKLEFKKKYKEKMESLERAKKLRLLRNSEIIPENNKVRGRNKNTSFSNFQKSNTLYDKIYQFLPLLNNKENKKYGNEYELILPYESPLLIRSMSTSEINPLSYDDFNRSYNTSQYFNIETNTGRSGSTDNTKNHLEYTIKFRSDMQLVKKPNKYLKNDGLMKKLRNLYKGKFERVFDNNQKSI